MPGDSWRPPPRRGGYRGDISRTPASYEPAAPPRGLDSRGAPRQGDPNRDSRHSRPRSRSRRRNSYPDRDAGESDDSPAARARGRRPNRPPHTDTDDASVSGQNGTPSSVAVAISAESAQSSRGAHAPAGGPGNSDNGLRNPRTSNADRSRFLARNGYSNNPHSNLLLLTAGRFFWRQIPRSIAPETETAAVQSVKSYVPTPEGQSLDVKYRPLVSLGHVRGKTLALTCTTRTHRFLEEMWEARKLRYMQVLTAGLPSISKRTNALEGGVGPNGLLYVQASAGRFETLIELGSVVTVEATDYIAPAMAELDRASFNQLADQVNKYWNGALSIPITPPQQPNRRSRSSSPPRDDISNYRSRSPQRLTLDSDRSSDRPHQDDRLRASQSPRQDLRLDPDGQQLSTTSRTPGERLSESPRSTGVAESSDATPPAGRHQTPHSQGISHETGNAAYLAHQSTSTLVLAKPYLGDGMEFAVYGNQNLHHSQRKRSPSPSTPHEGQEGHMRPLFHALSSSSSNEQAVSTTVDQPTPPAAQDTTRLGLSSTRDQDYLRAYHDSGADGLPPEFDEDTAEEVPDMGEDQSQSGTDTEQGARTGVKATSQSSTIPKKGDMTNLMEGLQKSNLKSTVKTQQMA